MPRINITAIEMPRDQRRREIDEWADSVKMRDISFIREICQAFCSKVEKYYKAGATPEDRLDRLDEIRKSLAEIGFRDGEETYSIAPSMSPNGRKTCPPGEKCHNGACVKEGSGN